MTAPQGTNALEPGSQVPCALFISVGVVTIALRDTLPLNGFDRDHLGFGSEVAFTVGLKVPIIIQGHDPTGFSFFGKN